MGIKVTKLEPEAGANPDALDISTVGKKLVYYVRDYQSLAVQLSPTPSSSTHADLVLTLNRAIDPQRPVALESATTLATGNGWYAAVDKSADPYDYLIVEVTAAHGSAGQVGRVEVRGAVTTL